MISQSIPDTFAYMAGGYAVIFVLLAAYTLSLRMRRIRLERQIRNLVSRQSEDRQGQDNESRSF